MDEPDLPIRTTPAALVDPREGSTARQFFRGMGYPARGLVFLWRNTDLWGWAAAPLLITAWMIAAAVWATVWYADDLVMAVWPRPDGDVLRLTLWMLAVRALQVLLFLLLAVVSWVFGNMISSPFWDVLAERAEQKLLDRPDTPFDVRIALGDAWMSVRHSILGLLLYVGIMGPLLLLNLVPGVGSVLYTVLSYPTTVFFVARELMDIPLSRRRTPFRDKLRWIGQHKPVLAGLGTAGMLMLAVPFVNLLVMPFAVMGGTLLYCQLHRVGEGVPQRGPHREVLHP